MKKCLYLTWLNKWYHINYGIFYFIFFAAEEILTTIRELKETIEQLHYREHKRVAIQGIIAACTFMEDACKMEMVCICL